MSKLYVFAIGGTGSRVLRSLTMLMAAGVEINAEIVPVIIDPDLSNADLTRTETLMNNYRSIRSKLTFTNGNPNRFFCTELGRIIPGDLLQMKRVQNVTFEQFLGLASMSPQNAALARMLFSDKNLASTMDVGFKGNPNIGSVALNQIAQTDEFVQFANSFQRGDSVFVINSIFGGTGASGFPLLVKLLRTNTNMPNANNINNARIGALTVLPYFQVNQNGNSEIDSSTFIGKAKSALAYYENNLVGNKSVDEIYYLADDGGAMYNNSEGGYTQKNDAHLIELFGATAIINFAKGAKGGISSTPTRQTVNYEFGIKDTSGGGVTFKQLPPKMVKSLYEPMVQLRLMAACLLDKKDIFLDVNAFDANKNFDKLFGSVYADTVCYLLGGYMEWLREMKDNNLALDLFNVDASNKPFDTVTDIKPSKFMGTINRDYKLIAERLNTAIKNCKSNSSEDRFVEMYWRATKELVDKKLKLR